MNAGSHHLLKAPVFSEIWKDPEDRRFFGGREEQQYCLLLSGLQFFVQAGIEGQVV